MKAHADVLSHFPEYKLSDEQRKKLHAELFEMMCDFKQICAENGLTFMLCGGTLLGAVRHGGFIPWDDDVDVMMPRSDYEKLYDVFEGNKKYYLDGPEKKECAHKMIKMMKHGTTYVEVGSDHPDYPSGKNLFIDIFPIDNMPKGKARLRALRFYVAFHAASLIYENKYRSPILEKLAKEDKEVKKYYRMRHNFARILRIFGSGRRHTKKALKLANYKKNTGYLGIPLGIAYNREKFEARILSEVGELNFCGVPFPVPAHYREYLVNLYGPNYMDPPPPEKRGSHAIAEFIPQSNESGSAKSEDLSAVQNNEDKQ